MINRLLYIGQSSFRANHFTDKCLFKQEYDLLNIIGI